MYPKDGIIEMLKCNRQLFSHFCRKGVPTEHQLEEIVPLSLADIFLLSREAESALDGKETTSELKFTHMYTDDVLSINKPYYNKCLG